MKKPACASEQDVLELVTLRYIKPNKIYDSGTQLTPLAKHQSLTRGIFITLI